MPGERLMPGEGQGGGPEAERPTGIPPVGIPGSSPEHKKSYQLPTPEEQARLEKALEAVNRAERTIASSQQIPSELELQLRNITENTNLYNFFGLSENDPDFQDKLKAVPQKTWNTAVDAKRAAEGKGPAAHLQGDISGLEEPSLERKNALLAADNARYRDALERLSQEREGGREIITKENWMEAERYDHAPAYNEDYLSVRILDQMGRHMWVYWPKDEAQATTRVRDVVGRIELAREDVDPQLSLEYQRIQAILGAIKASKVLEQGFDLEHKLVRIEDGNQIKKIKEFNERLGTEFKGRRTFHQAFFTYETQSSIEAVVKSAVTLGPNDFNALFAMEEIIPGTNKPFNPFVVALQFYEDHGHEFASNNSETGRPEFGKQVFAHIAAHIEKIAREKGIEVPVINSEDYKWAQNMAERFFRFSGRAEMYDYLVWEDDKTGKKQIVKYFDPAVHPVYGTPHKGEKIPVRWASDRDGCDYDMTKIIRFREFLRAEGGLRAHIGLLNDVDTFGGDLLTRTVRAAKPGIPFITYRVPKEELEERIKAKTKDLIDKDKKTPEEAKEIATKLYLEIDEQNQLYAEADSFTDRDDLNNKGDNKGDNKGEQVGHLDFSLLQRTKIKNEAGEEIYEGFDFKSMGTTPLGLWVTRYVNGPEKLREALMGKAESFLINPNIESYRALINAFDFQKIFSHENLRQLGINLIDFSQNKRKEKTGRPNLNRTEIIAMVNDLTGLTDPNKPAVFNMEDRKEILEKTLGHRWGLINIAITVKDGIIGFILGILGHILKQGFSDVGK